MASWLACLLQGLFLNTDGDRLVGRAENGMLWTWDLTRTLGWQSLSTLPWQQTSSSGGGSGGASAAAGGGGCGGAAGYPDGDYCAASGGLGAARGGGSAGVAAELWAQPGEGAGCWLSAASLPEEVKTLLWLCFHPINWLLGQLDIPQPGEGVGRLPFRRQPARSNTLNQRT